MLSHFCTDHAGGLPHLCLERIALAMITFLPVALGGFARSFPVMTAADGVVVPSPVLRPIMSPSWLSKIDAISAWPGTQPMLKSNSSNAARMASACAKVSVAIL